MDIDFNNAAGFQGVPAKVTEGQFIVSSIASLITILFWNIYFLSQNIPINK